MFLPTGPSNRGPRILRLPRLKQRERPETPVPRCTRMSWSEIGAMVSFRERFCFANTKQRLVLDRRRRGTAIGRQLGDTRGPDGGCGTGNRNDPLTSCQAPEGEASRSESSRAKASAEIAPPCADPPDMRVEEGLTGRQSRFRSDHDAPTRSFERDVARLCARCRGGPALTSAPRRGPPVRDQATPSRGERVGPLRPEIAGGARCSIGFRIQGYPRRHAAKCLSKRAENARALIQVCHLRVRTAAAA